MSASDCGLVESLSFGRAFGEVLLATHSDLFTITIKDLSKMTATAMIEAHDQFSIEYAKS